MKLYKFSVNRDKIQKEEIEVTEKNKIFEQQRGRSTSRYKKEDLDVLDTSYGCPTMISLNGSPENFIKQVIEFKKKRVSNLEIQVTREKNEIISMQRAYERFLCEGEHDGKFATKFEVVFEHTEDSHIKGNAIKHDYEMEFGINHLISCSELVSRIESGEKIRIVNIFVDNAITNLYVEKLMNTTETLEDCVINLDKLAEIALKAKVQIDILQG